MEPLVTTEQRPKTNPIEKLHPEKFTDDDGAGRDLFTFRNKQGNDVRVIFYTREELPFSQQALTGRSCVILGDKPKHRDISEWYQFIQGVRNSNTSTSRLDPINPIHSRLQEETTNGNVVFLVENTPVHLLDLVFYLGAGSPQLREARKRAAVDNIYTKEVLDLLDDAIAGTVIDGNGKLRERFNQEGEALTVLALLGDREAREALDSRKVVIESLDERKQLDRQLLVQHQRQALQSGSVNPRNFHAYHVTGYRPHITLQGVVLRSPFDASGGVDTRDTVHFSLLDPITSNFGGGGWENMDYIILGDLSKIRERNGNPIMINPIDTYFALNPGQPLILPDAHVIMPGFLPVGSYRETRGAITFYKKDLLLEDINSLFLDHFDSLRDVEKQEVFRKFQDMLHRAVWVDGFSGVMRDDESRLQEYWERYTSFRQSLNFEEIFSRLRSQGVNPTVKELLTDSGFFSEKDVKRIQEYVKAWLVSKARDGSMINVTESQDVGNDYTFRRRKAAMALAAEWGTVGSMQTQAHDGDPDGGGNLEDRLAGFFRSVRTVRENLSKLTLDENNKDARGYFHPRPNIFRIKGLSMPIDILSRKSIMAGFREARLNLADFPHFMLPQHRRMMYVAGEI